MFEVIKQRKRHSRQPFIHPMQVEYKISSEKTFKWIRATMTMYNIKISVNYDTIPITIRHLQLNIVEVLELFPRLYTNCQKIINHIHQLHKLKKCTT